MTSRLKFSLWINLSLLLIILIFSSCRKQEKELPYEIVLEEGWHIQSSAEVDMKGDIISREGLDLTGWYPASVPTTVLAALIKNGEYPAPFYGKNLENIPSKRFAGAWWYRKEFDLPAENTLPFVRLGFDGINYRANIWLNGRQIASQEQLFGSFRVFKLDITEAAKSGKNILAVEVFPPQPGDFTIGFVDWNPKPPDKNMGLWRPVTMHLSGPVSIDNPFLTSKINLETLAEASLTITAEVGNHSDKTVEGELQGELEGSIFTQKVSLTPKERKTVVFLPGRFAELNLKNPRLWWPNNLGEQNLYVFNLRFLTKGKTSDAETVTFGIREVTDYMNDEGHRGYKINGQKILIRGGGWVDDLFLADDDRTLEAKVKYTKHMNLNAIRLEGFWGSGPKLYDLCDQHGILLMAGWSCQWEWDDYVGKTCDEFGGVQTAKEMDLVAQSFQDQVVLWRNHPSVFVWLLGSDKLPRPELERDYIQILEKYDPSRPYLAAAARLTSEVSGATGVKMLGPYDYVPPIYWFEDRKNGGAYGFNTETGPGPQPPPLESLKRMLPEEHLWPIDDTWDYHCARNEFNNLNRYREALDRRYSEAKDVEDFIRKAQVANYEAMRAMFEAFAAHKHNATGVIQWMLNAAWPKLYWQLYDYYLMPNGAFYGAKKASRPLHILYHYKNNSIYVVNDVLIPRNDLRAEIRVFDLLAKEVFKEIKDVNLEPNASLQIFQLPDLPNLSSVYFLDLRLTDTAGKLFSDNFYWLSTKKDVLDYTATKWFVTPIKKFADLKALDSLPEVKLHVQHSFEQREGEQKVHVTLKNPSDSIAFFVHVNVAGGQSGNSILPIYWDDNCLSILPGESRTLAGIFNPEDLRGEEPVVHVDGWNVKGID